MNLFLRLTFFLLAAAVTVSAQPAPAVIPPGRATFEHHIAPTSPYMPKLQEVLGTVGLFTFGNGTFAARCSRGTIRTKSVTEARTGLPPCSNGLNLRLISVPSASAKSHGETPLFLACHSPEVTKPLMQAGRNRMRKTSAVFLP
jgi:hypothetical protein